MKRLLLLTLSIAIAVSVVAVVGARSFGGSGGVVSIVSADTGTGTMHLEIDMVQDAGASTPTNYADDVWCDPIQASASHDLGTTYQVAVCLTDANPLNNEVPKAFQFNLEYDDTLNTCLPVDCDTDAETEGIQGPCRDSNPDANEGVSFFSTPDLGSGWNCNASDVDPPVCDKDPTHPKGVAYLSCFSTSAGTLPVSTTTSEPIAVVTFKANSTTTGTDTLKLNLVAMYGAAGGFLFCDPPPAAPGPCKSATDNKTVPPTATPPPAECDFADGTFAANPPALTMKVGDPPAIVDVSGQWTNQGAITQGAADLSCRVGFAWGAASLTAIPGVFAPIPAGLSVRVDPFGAPITQGVIGDVCLICNPYNPAMVGKDISVCLAGKGPFDKPTPDPDPTTWTYSVTNCDEVIPGVPSLYPFSFINHGCEDGIDNNSPLDGKYDWAGFSTTPDPNCHDVHAIGITPLVKPAYAPDQSTAVMQRQVKVQCNERGTYNLVLFGSSTKAYDSVFGATQDPGPPYRDPDPTNDASYAALTVNCTKGPEMVKDCDVDKAGIQDTCTLWLMDPEFAGGVEPNTDPPVLLPPADDNGCVKAEWGKGCLAVDVWLKSADDDPDPNDNDLIPECLGAWEHQVRFDHKILKFVNDLSPLDWDGDTVAEATSWMDSEGRIANCTISVLAEDWILEGCVSKDDLEEDGVQLGPCGDGIIERMLIVPQTQDLIYRGVFRPTKDNGVVTNIVDDNCEITDIYGEPMADTLPGQLTPVCGDLHITIRMLEGDTDLDCDVDVIDDAALAMRYGSSWGLLLYNQWFDLEGPQLSIPDGDIDIKDLQFVFGRNYSTCQDPIPDDQSTPVDPGQP